VNIMIIGHGFVGQAVDYAFVDYVKKIVDPKYGTNIDDDDLLHYDAIFVCVPTPMGIGGSVDTSILDSVLEQVKHHPTVIVKSTVTPDVINKYDVIYNPEFLTERSAAEQFVSAKFHILGGDRNSTERVEEIYRLYSLCQHAEFLHMTAQEASFVKYTINSFLATKVTFFNQLYDTVKDTDANFNTIIKAVGMDSRIGISHTRVPGFDGKQGYGGACFPKDTSAFAQYNNKLTLLEKCIIINNEYRSQYELDDREKEQNVKYYGQTKEEQ
jgi:nucleotide sugar dehydrogenase